MCHGTWDGLPALPLSLDLCHGMGLFLHQPGLCVGTCGM